MSAFMSYFGVLNQGGAPALLEDLQANRPAPAFAGRIFIGTDSLLIQRDTGSAWITIGGGGPSPTNAWLDGGNSFGHTGVIGTLDNNNMQFITHGIPKLTLTVSDLIGPNSVWTLFGTGAAIFGAGVNMANNSLNPVVVDDDGVMQGTGWILNNNGGVQFALNGSDSVEIDDNGNVTSNNWNIANNCAAFFQDSIDIDSGGNNISINGGSIIATQWGIQQDGSGQFAGGDITWDNGGGMNIAAGMVQITGAGDLLLPNVEFDTNGNITGNAGAWAIQGSSGTAFFAIAEVGQLIVPGTTGQTISYANPSTPPVNTAIPVAWALVELSGTAYKMALYQ